MPEHTGEGECFESNQVSQEIIDAIEKAVGIVLTRMYNGREVDDTGMLEAEIAGWIQNEFRLAGIELDGKPVFDRGVDEERGNWINATVRITPDTPKEILIEFVKCLPPEADDGFVA